MGVLPDYQQDLITAYYGDYKDVITSLGQVDAIVSDPPYGMANNTDSTRFTGGTSRSHRKIGGGRNDWEDVLGDDKPFDPSPWLGFEKVCLFGSNHFSQKLPRGTTLVWIKKSPNNFGTFLSDAEIGWMKGGHGVYCYYEYMCPTSRALEACGECAHPNQKPISLMRWILTKMKLGKGVTVLDPFMGSGTTGIACAMMGLRFIGIEKQRAYFDKATERFKDYYGGNIMREMKLQLKRTTKRKS